MGVETRRPILPAPTESVVDTMTGCSVAGTDLATDVSHRTDKSSYSVPEDGRPITIPIRPKHRDRSESSKLAHSSHHSQTSLLIEYFEGGKGSSSLVARPSVRVRVTPSATRKLRDKNEHIQITESSGGRKPVYTRRISLSSPSKQKRLLTEAVADDQSISSSNSVGEDGHQSYRDPPIEIEVVKRDRGSELFGLSRETRALPAASDISSMPPDSMLEGPSSSLQRKRSQSLERGDNPEDKDLLRTPSRQRSRSLSTERIAHRVAEKLSSAPRERSSSKLARLRKDHPVDGEFLAAESKSSRRRRQGYQDDELPSAESSLLSGSAVSSHRRSGGDQYSIRSGTSKSSINNPRLLETVEDAIRRLILPELKELKKDHKSSTNSSNFDGDFKAPYPSPGPTPKDGPGRHLSKHASAPNVMKPMVVLSKASEEDELASPSEQQLSGNTKDGKSNREVEEKHNKSYVKKSYRPELTEKDKIRRQKSKGLRDAEAAAIVGTALTTAALRHHDSLSSLASRDSDDRRRRRRSGKHSRGGTGNDTELIFERHNVAPMPLRSEVDSGFTRDSILSQQTADSETTRTEKAHEVFHGSPKQIITADSRSRSHTPRASRTDLRAKHSDDYLRDSSGNRRSAQDMHPDARSSIDSGADEFGVGAIAAAAAANLLDAYPGGDGYDKSGNRPALSPIQSVVSDQTEARFQHHGEYESPLSKEELKQKLSIDSLSSAPSTSLARSSRPEGFNFENPNELLEHDDDNGGPELGYEESSRELRLVESDDNSSAKDDGYDDLGDAKYEGKRMTNYTDNSELDYMDNINRGQHVANVANGNPQFIHPTTVESAVASLLDPSVVDSKSNQSANNRSATDFEDQLRNRNAAVIEDASRDFRQTKSPKQFRGIDVPDPLSFPKRMGVTSPPQSITQSIEEEDRPNGTGLNDASELDSPEPDFDQSQDSESEINTNPSIIQGPIGGPVSGNLDHWPYEATPPKADQAPFGFSAADGEAFRGTGQTFYAPTSRDDAYVPNEYYFGQPDGMYAHDRTFTATPSGAKDEGYASAANARSPSVGTPKPRNLDSMAMSLFESPGIADDQFGLSQQRHLSGYSYGMSSSPFYEGATGNGIESIESKDIIALMEHLTVRDAQRNARDTEILVTLVRSAAEMRNSFEEMKKFISLQDERLIEAGDKQHERTQRAVIGGPRPQPLSTSKSSRQVMTDDGDDQIRSKKKNLFKRALKGLSLRSSNDLSRIEEMLEQLLEEVEALRAAQNGRIPASAGQDGSNVAAAGANGVDPEGYEPEGRAGTSSTPDQSGYFSSSSRPAYDTHGNILRRELADGRVSIVHEEDEEEENANFDEERDEFLSPHLQQLADEEQLPRSSQMRAGSSPLTTPPRAVVANNSAHSNETTPRTADKSRKHKSSSSSFFPKISRWSKTTASSVGDNIRNSFQPGRKDRPYSYASRSGSDLANEMYNSVDYYDPRGDDRIRSTYTLDEQQQQQQQEQQQENRAPSPLVPSQVSETPKYRAHRDSMDLQHPQPRQGPSGRYQSQLESQAQNFHTPISPNSDPWGSNTSLSYANANQNRYSGGGLGGRLSPISDAGYSESNSRAEKQVAPARPPKIKDDGPLVPERPPKVMENEKQGDYSYSGDHVAQRTSAIRQSSYAPPTRKPTGPRPLASTAQNSPGKNVKRTRYRGSPDQIDDEFDY